MCDEVFKSKYEGEARKVQGLGYTRILWSLRYLVQMPKRLTCAGLCKLPRAIVVVSAIR